MKARRNFIFTLIISAIYFISVMSYGISLFCEFNNGKKLSQERFNGITKDISKITKVYSPKTKEFYDSFLVALGNVSDIAALQLKYGEELIFSYPKDMQALNNANSSLVASYNTLITTESSVPVTLTSSIYLLKPTSIYVKGRMAFLVILAATLIVIFYLVFYIKNGVFPKENERDIKPEDDYEYPEIESYNDEELSETEIETVQEEKNNDEETPVEEADSKEKEEDILSFLDKDNDNDKKVNQVEIEKTTEDEVAPKGLFSPVTGFGWEEYMLTRLDSELIRSASSDQDIALITIRIPNIDWNDETGHKVSSLILEFVKFNDLVFNYKEDGLSVILQNHNTDQTMIWTEELNTKLENLFTENNSTLKFAAGISNRTLRLISGKRLANESEEALFHALEDDDSPIVAFRVNPEKYRNFLASESYQPDMPKTDYKESSSKEMEEIPESEESSDVIFSFTDENNQ